MLNITLKRNGEMTSFVGEVGDIVLQTQKSTIEWNAGDFLSLSDKVDDCYRSPVFSFAGSPWYLMMFPNGSTEHSSEGYVGLYLKREGQRPPQTVHFTFNYKGSWWGKEALRNTFSIINSGYGIRKCWTRKMFNDHETTIICHLRSDDFCIPQTLPDKEVQTLRQQIKNFEKRIENYELESENYKKQISASETEKSSLQEKYSCLQEEKNTKVSVLEKDNDRLRNKIESLMKRIGIVQKATEDFELESENCQKQISASESEKARIEEKYKCLLEENSNTVSRLLKDKDHLRENMRFLMQHKVVLGKEIENYELESLKCQKQTSALESEKAHIGEKFKCLLEENSNAVSDKDHLRENMRFLMEHKVVLGKESLKCQKQINALESEKAHIEEKYKCLLEENSNAVSDNNLLRKKMESMMERIEVLEKATENYELESENYKKQISDSESEKSPLEKKYKCLLEEKYKCLLEEKITNVSDNDLRKKMESLMERTEVLKKATENYELESENYRKQISASESKKSSLEEKYKCLLEENSIIVSRLKNALCFVAFFFVLFEILVLL